MPIYEYQCHTCGQVSEVLMQKINNNVELTCTKCGSNDLQKLISIPNLLKERRNTMGTTCCGRTERCEKPPCSSSGKCSR